MLRYLLDTNICIFTIKNRPESVRVRFTEEVGRMAISTVTAMELMYGVERSQQVAHNRKVTEGFINRLTVLDYDHKAAAHTAQIRAELARLGKPIGPYDQMIAAHARSRGFVLVTNNTREFERVPGLMIEDWVVS